MKILLILFLIFSNIVAQPNFGLTTGFNLSKILYPDDGIEPSEINFMPGLNIGVEVEKDWMKFGLSFQQRGSKEVLKFSDTLKVTGNYVYNFYSWHLLRQHRLGQSITVLGGLHGGWAMNAQLKVETEVGPMKLKETIKRNSEELDIGWDFGLLIGGEYMFNSAYGLRLLYYHPLLEQKQKLDFDENFTFTSIIISGIYNFKL